MNSSTPDTLDRLLQGAGLRNDRQLAEILGVTPQAVSQARRKGRIPDGWVLKIASLYGLSTDWIFFGKGDGQAGAATAGETPAPQVDGQLFNDFIP